MTDNMATPSVIEDKLKYLLDTRKEELSRGDLEFASSLQKGFNKKGRLTPAQLPWLDRLVDKYDEDKMNQQTACRQAWVDEYRTDVEKKRVFEICVEYYEANKPYFGQVIASYRADEKGYAPTQKTYYKMCENKYAKKVIDERNKAPVFAEGEMVALRSTRGPTRHQYLLKVKWLLLGAQEARQHTTAITDLKRLEFHPLSRILQIQLL